MTEMVPLKPLAKQVGAEKGFEDSSFYGRVLVDAKRDDLIGIDPETKQLKEAGILKEGGRYIVDPDLFIPYLNRKYPDSAKNSIDAIDPRWSLDDFLRCKGVYALAEFCHRFGKPLGPLDLYTSKITPRKGRDKKELKNLGFIRINDTWCIVMDTFLIYLETKGYLARYRLEKR